MQQWEAREATAGSDGRLHGATSWAMIALGGLDERPLRRLQVRQTT